MTENVKRFLALIVAVVICILCADPVIRAFAETLDGAGAPAYSEVTETDAPAAGPENAGDDDSQEKSITSETGEGSVVSSDTVSDPPVSENREQEAQEETVSEAAESSELQPAAEESNIPEPSMKESENVESSVTDVPSSAVEDTPGIEEPVVRPPFRAPAASGRVPAVEDETLNDEGQVIKKVAITINGKNPDENDIYQLRTGNNITYTIAISNEDNHDSADAIRIYFDYSGKNYALGSFPISDVPYTIRNSSGTEYTMKVIQCKDSSGNDMPGKFYYEIQGIKAGETLAFQNDVFYQSPESAGGDLKVWTVSIPSSQAQDGGYIEPKQYLQIHWGTSPVSFTLTKQNSSSISGKTVNTHFEGDGTGSDTLYLKGLGFTIRETYDSSSGNGTGQDLVRSVDYEDVLTLPGSSHWADGVIDAIRNGNYTAKVEVVPSTQVTGYYGYSIYANVDGKQIKVLSLQDYSYRNSSNVSTGIRDLTPTVVEDKNGNETIKITWTGNNPYKTEDSATREYPVKTFSLVYGDEVIAGDLDALNEELDSGNKPMISNSAKETRHYSWSDDQTSASAVSKDVPLDASLETEKYWKSNNSNYADYYGGADSPFVFVMKNTGIANLKDWGNTDQNGNARPMITDTLEYLMYITPENIEKMFADKAVKGSEKIDIGHWLTVTVTGASLFTPNEEGYGQEVFAENNAAGDKYTNGLPGKDDSLITNNARFVLALNDQGELKLTVSGSGDAGVDGTYTIGSGKDYDTLDKAFKTFGFMPTNATRYKVEYQPGEDELLLKSGQNVKITVPASMKTTYMLLTQDSESYYGNNDIRFRNSAVFNAYYGDENRTFTRYTPYRDWIRESYLYKNGYIADRSKSISGTGVLVDDGDVIDYNVYFYRYNQNVTTQWDYDSKTERNMSPAEYQNKPYEKMPISDLVSGAQVVLVPKDLNPDLKAPDGSSLKVYKDSQNIEYWMLNVPGTYTDLDFGTASRVTSAAGTYTRYHADSITVTKNADRSLSTLIKWSPFDNWGGRRYNSNGTINTNSNSGTTNVWYKVLVSGSESGMMSGDTSGQKFSLKNKCWQGDHQRRRLYDTLDGFFWIYSFSKYIVAGENDASDTVEPGSLIKDSRIRKGDVVTYQLTINNISEGDTILTGTSISDALPQTRGVFDWIKGENVVSLRYVPTDATVYIRNGEETVDIWEGGADGSWKNGIGDEKWSIGTQGRNSTAVTVGQQHLLWDKDFCIGFKPQGSIRILVDLVFPSDSEEGSTWAEYVNKNNGHTLYNYFYIKDQGSWRSDYARHLPLADGKAVLRKGVYDTGWTTRDQRSTTWGHQYMSRNTRMTYANSGETGENSDYIHISTVTYYTELYNGSNERLYLEPFYDKLPEGFTFNNMVNLNYHNTTDWDSYSDYSSYPGYCGTGRRPSTVNIYTEGNNNSDNDRLATVDNRNDENDNHTVQYVNAYIKSSTRKSGNTQYVTFTVAGAGSNYTTHPSIGYDSKVGRYYLDPGQALRFGYNVVPGRYEDTEDIAINTIAMPYYNYYGTDFEMDDYEKLVPSRKNGLEPNDGQCEQMQNSEVRDLFGFDTSAYEGKPAYTSEEEGNWLVSQVSVSREDFVPGLSKSVQGSTPVITNVSANTIQGSRGSNSGALYGTPYVGGLKSSDVVNWRIRVFAENNSMTDYTIVDTVDTPYKFTGQIFYNMYRQSGSGTVKENSASWYLFTLGSRTADDTKVRIAAGQSVDSNSRMLNIGSAEDDSDDEWYSFGSGKTAGKVKIEKLSDGREQMTIQLTGLQHTVVAEHFVDFCIHTQFCSDLIIISEGKYNDSVVVPSKDYRAGSVTSGRPLTHNEIVDGKNVTVNDGVEAGASVMIVQGYTTKGDKTITEIGKASNTASSEDSKNYISISEDDKPFRYDLRITGPKAVISRLVMIDALPEVGDHSAFVQSDVRNSEFTVSFYKEPDVHVYLKKKGQNEVELKGDQFVVELNTKTEFTAKDWECKGDGWKPLSECSEDEIVSARSVRVIINDADAYKQQALSAYMMPDETQIHISFVCDIHDEKAEPGKIGWNSYGYYYTVPQTFNGSEENSIGISLMAQPLPVGVKYPAAPEITKKLVDEEVNAHEAEKDLTFGFIVYRGNRIDGLNNALDMSEAYIAAALGDREYTYVTLTVEKGKTEGKYTFWDKETHLYSYEDGWKEGQDKLHWIGGESYNIVELPLGDYRYSLADINGDSNNFTFLQNIGDTVALQVTNAFIDERMIIKGEKIWDDEDDRDGIRPDTITINLKADDEVIDEFEAKAENDYSFSVTDLPRYHDDGTEIVYDIEEKEVEGYEAEYASEETTTVVKEESGDGTEPASKEYYTIVFKVTNTHVPEMTDVDVEKIWDDAEDQDGIRPVSVKVYLYADDENVAEAVLDSENEWKHVFEGLNKYRDKGTEITYTIVEETLEDYSTEYEVDGYSWKVKNSYTPLETSHTVRKVWDDSDNRDESRPQTIEAELYADGEATGKTCELSEENDWLYTWNELPLRKSGRDIVYTVKETEVPEGYEVSCEEAEETTIIKNTHEPEITEITVTKVWEDEDDREQIRPESIEVVLLRNGEQDREPVVLNEENGWTYTWTDLLKVSRGEEITYSVEEPEVPEGYEVSYEEGEGTVTIKNTHEPETTEVTVLKVWEDEDDRDRIRPWSIKVVLLKNGEQEGEPIYLSSENEWTYTWTDLLVKQKGQEITYTVEETDVPEGYESETSVEDGNTVITNRHVPSEEHGPKTGEGNALLIWTIICLASLLTLFMVARKELSVR